MFCILYIYPNTNNLKKYIYYTCSLLALQFDRRGCGEMIYFNEKSKKKKSNERRIFYS